MISLTKQVQPMFNQPSERSSAWFANLGLLQSGGMSHSQVKGSENGIMSTLSTPTRPHAY